MVLAHSHHDDAVHQGPKGPVACVALTLAVAAVFWAGLIWAAVRLYG
jgi:hypothetical protein